MKNGLLHDLCVIDAPSGREDAVRAFILARLAELPTKKEVTVDPMGNVMLRWPLDPEPQRVKKDLSRLLTASSHWVRVPRK